MGNFQTFLSSDCFSEKYQEIVRDVKAIEEKFEKLNSSNALKIQYKNLFDNLLVKLENPQYIDVDETMTYIRKILKKLKVYNESDISDIETAIKNLSVKVSLFLYDDDNNDSRIYLNLLKKRELQLINDCISLIDYHAKRNYNNLDPLYKSLRKTNLGSKLLEKENRNLYIRENIPVLSGIIENINVQSLEPSLDLPAPKTSARQKVNRADQNISNAKVDIHNLLQEEEEDDSPVEYRNDNAQEILKRKINKLKHDVSDHPVKNPLQPPALSKASTDFDSPMPSIPYSSGSTSQMKPPPSVTNPSMSIADNISQLSEDDASILSNVPTFYSNRQSLTNPFIDTRKRTDPRQESKSVSRYSKPFYDQRKMDDRSLRQSLADDQFSQSLPMDDRLTQQSLDDRLSRRSLSQQTMRLNPQRRKLSDDIGYKDENVNNLPGSVPKANFFDSDQISRAESQQTQLDKYNKQLSKNQSRQSNDLNKINEIRKRLQDAQKVLTEENRRKKKDRNLFKRQVEKSTRNILKSKKNGKKIIPTFKQFLKSLESS